MKVNLDIFEMYYLLESCFRGSHLRSATILRFVDEWYSQFTAKQRRNLYTWILRDIYDGHFEPRPQLCGADEVFMCRFDPDNQYRVSLKGGESYMDAFLWKNRYYISRSQFCNPELITKVEKIHEED